MIVINFFLVGVDVDCGVKVLMARIHRMILEEKTFLWIFGLTVLGCKSSVLQYL